MSNHIFFLLLAKLVYGLHRGVFDLDIDEEEVLKLATLGNGANSKDTIDTYIA